MKMVKKSPFQRMLKAMGMMSSQQMLLYFLVLQKKIKISSVRMKGLQIQRLQMAIEGFYCDFYALG